MYFDEIAEPRELLRADLIAHLKTCGSYQVAKTDGRWALPAQGVYLRETKG